MKKLTMILLLCIFSITTYSANAQTTKVSDEYQKELTKYYKLSGQDASINSAVDGMMANLPQDKKAILKREIFEKMIKEVINAIAPVYEKNISLADLKAMNKFYSEGAGKRIADAMPKMTNDIMAVMMTIVPTLQKIMQESMAK